MINVPNYNSLSIKLGIDDFKWFQNTPTGHLYYFTPTTLKNYLKKEHFKNIKTISVWLGHPKLRKFLFYDKSPRIKRIVKEILNWFGIGNDLLVIARK
ncbi:MAG: hypothetical protein NC935_06395 [Candidatus Omnitrophica bacterium]|nr:hypothetical protein [Candidatus Omnitrophota bacterium]